MMRLPADIEAGILARAGLAGIDRTTRSRHARRLRVVREQMMRLSAEFTPGVSSTARYSDAYFLYNFPVNLVKTMRVVGEIQRFTSFPGGRARVRLLDIGCGEGAGLLGTYYALRSAYPTLEFRMTGIDRSAKMLERGRQMVRSIGGRETRVKVRLLNLDAADVSQAVYDRKYDIVLCVNSLAEIVKEPVLPRDLMSRLYGCVAEDGVFVIIEPALKVFSRRLMELRDGLAAHRGLQVILPCQHNGACALLQIKGKDEWCHESIPWSPPAFLRILNEGLNREISLLKFSYLVVARTRAVQPEPAGYRVISHLLKEKGRMRCFLCSPQGRIELVRLNRAKSADNARFDRIAKGSIVELKNVKMRRPDFWEVSSDTAVRLVL